MQTIIVKTLHSMNESILLSLFLLHKVPTLSADQLILILSVALKLVITFSANHATSIYNSFRG